MRALLTTGVFSLLLIASFAQAALEVGGIQQGELESIHETASRGRTGGETQIRLLSQKLAVCQTNSMASQPGYNCRVQLNSTTAFSIESSEIQNILTTMRTVVSGSGKQFKLKDQSVLRCRMNDFSQRPGFTCSLVSAGARAELSCPYPEGSCGYYSECLHQWPPHSCT